VITAQAQPAAAGDPAAAAPAIHVTSLRKRYGDVTALADVDLVVRAGEFFTLLGPSGSGKTTLLRLIAGFERPDAGRIELGRPRRHPGCRRTPGTSTPCSRTTRCSRT
jgi:putative spermidine/putrescine transport system ATP-binding protein